MMDGPDAETAKSASAVLVEPPMEERTSVPL